MAAVIPQGSGSDVGKSVLVPGFYGALPNRGLCVLLLKPQNMSNNAAMAVDGGKIGRTQELEFHLQVEALRASTKEHMA